MKTTKNKIKGLSEREVKVIAWLEFHQKYFFTSDDISHFFKNKQIMYSAIKRFMKKNRIIKLNQKKYYLVPIKAKSGSWSEHSFIIADETLNSEGYYIGGWSAANYWKLTEQIPMKISVYTNKRQGKKTILNTKFIFHRIRKENIRKSVIRKIRGHSFRILSKKESEKWLKLRNW
ncbi:MAG: hypothetical protein KJ600_03740 [Nanoarchaeota archaeon]|nr:hypothetical protein [Nanoarchaeota archaeon]